MVFLTTPLEYLDYQDINNNYIGRSGKVKEKIRRFQFFFITGFEEIGGRDHTTVMHACPAPKRTEYMKFQHRKNTEQLTGRFGAG